MKPLFRHGKARFTTAVVLCVWLLTLGAGFVHACLCPAEPAHAGEHAQESDHPHPARVAQPLAAAQTAFTHPDFAPPCTAPAGQMSAASRGVRHADLVQGKTPKPAQLAPFLTEIRWRTADGTERAARRPTRNARLWVERPVAIRFLRLTL